MMHGVKEFIEMAGGWKEALQLLWMLLVTGLFMLGMLYLLVKAIYEGYRFAMRVKHQH